MGKFIKSLFLVVIFIGLMSGIAKAQGFWVKITDANKDGLISFIAAAYNNSTQVYYTGVADINHTSLNGTLLIPPASSGIAGSNSTSLFWKVTPGNSLYFDIYLTDGSTYYWTSEGAAVGGTTGNTTLTINWLAGSSNIPVYNFSFSFTGDTFAIVPVPLPSAFWLFASGLVILGGIVSIRKKLLAN